MNKNNEQTLQVKKKNTFARKNKSTKTVHFVVDGAQNKINCWAISKKSLLRFLFFG